MSGNEEPTSLSSVGGKEEATHGSSDGDDRGGAILAACASLGVVAGRAESAGSGVGGGYAARAISDGGEDAEGAEGAGSKGNMDDAESTSSDGGDGGAEVASSEGGGENAESMSSKSGRTNLVCACAPACARVGGKHG